MRRRLSEIIAQTQAEMETLKKTETELRQGHVKLEDLSKKLDQEQVNPILHSIKLRLGKFLGRAKSKEA